MHCIILHKLHIFYKGRRNLTYANWMNIKCNAQQSWTASILNVEVYNIYHVNFASSFMSSPSWHQRQPTFFLKSLDIIKRLDASQVFLICNQVLAYIWTVIRPGRETVVMLPNWNCDAEVVCNYVHRCKGTVNQRDVLLASSFKLTTVGKWAFSYFAYSRFVWTIKCIVIL